MIKSVKLTNFLSFGANSEEIELQPLNVIIGRNGSGKSNFIEAIDLLRKAPSSMTTAIREGGGIADWLHKNHAGVKYPAIMEFVVENRANVSKERFPEIRYQISFANEGQRFVILDEKITSSKPEPGKTHPYLYYDYAGGNPIINVVWQENARELSLDDITQEQSILSQRRDMNSYPEITTLAKELEYIRLYREWSFGRHAPMRNPVKVDALSDFLEENGANLPLFLNTLEYLGAKQTLLRELTLFYNDITDYFVKIENVTAQLFFREHGLRDPVPATRLSDGTIRYLSLLSVLLHPNPPSVICIDEPELGLHPDILPTIGRLLIEASERCQLIVTTHSPVLIDSLSDKPDCVLVAEKEESQTILARLDENELRPWLEKYRLGELWSRGDLGGNIW